MDMIYDSQINADHSSINTPSSRPPLLSLSDRTSPRLHIHEEKLKLKETKQAAYLTTSPQTWTEYDFIGTYHIRNGKSKFPIPGKIITYELEKQRKMLEANNKILADEKHRSMILAAKRDVHIKVIVYTYVTISSA